MFSSTRDCWNAQHQNVSSQQRANTHHTQRYGHVSHDRYQFRLPGLPVNSAFPPSPRMLAGNVMSARHPRENSMCKYSPYPTFDGPNAGMKFGYPERLHNRSAHARIWPDLSHTVPQPEREKLSLLSQVGYPQHEIQTGIGDANLVGRRGEPSPIFSKWIPEPVCGQPSRHGFDYNQMTPLSVAHQQFPSHASGLLSNSTTPLRTLPIRTHTPLPRLAHHPNHVPRHVFEPRNYGKYQECNSYSAIMPSVSEKTVKKSCSAISANSFCKLRNSAPSQQATFLSYDGMPVSGSDSVQNSLERRQISNNIETPTPLDNFNLDILLNDSSGLHGSFMQQLEDLDSSSIVVGKSEVVVKESQLGKGTYNTNASFQENSPDAQKRALSQGLESHLPHISNDEIVVNEPACYSSVDAGIDAGGLLYKRTDHYHERHENFKHPFPKSDAKVPDTSAQNPERSSVSPCHLWSQRTSAVNTEGSVQSLSCDVLLSNIPSSAVKSSGYACAYSKTYPLPMNSSAPLTCPHSSHHRASACNSLAVTCCSKVSNSTSVSPAQAPLPRNVKPSHTAGGNKIAAVEIDVKAPYRATAPGLANNLHSDLNVVDMVASDGLKTAVESVIDSGSDNSSNLLDSSTFTETIEDKNAIANEDYIECGPAPDSKNTLHRLQCTKEEGIYQGELLSQVCMEASNPTLETMTNKSKEHSTKFGDHCCASAQDVSNSPQCIESKQNLASIDSIMVNAPERSLLLDSGQFLNIPRQPQAMSQSVLTTQTLAEPVSHPQRLCHPMPGSDMHSAEQIKNSWKEACSNNASYIPKRNYSMSDSSQSKSYQQHNLNAQAPSCDVVTSKKSNDADRGTFIPRQLQPRLYESDSKISIRWHGPVKDGLHFPSEKHVQTDQECSESLMKQDRNPATAIVIKKRKRPFISATSKKKKRKKNDDLEEFGSSLSLTQHNKSEQMRRSCRNVKRKEYSENIEHEILDEILQHEFDDSSIAEEQHLNPPLPHGQKIVEKILDMRVRNRKENKPSKHTPIEAQSAQSERENNESAKETSEVSIPPVHKDGGAEGNVGKDGQAEDNVIPEIEEYFIKYKNLSYIHCEWKTKEELSDNRVDGKIKRFKSKLAAMPEYLKVDLSEPFNPDYVEVDRVLDVAQEEDEGCKNPLKRNFLVKWCSLPYEESTWERENDIPEHKIHEFQERCDYKPLSCPANSSNSYFRKLSQQHATFCNGNRLRDYQLEGVNWLLFNWFNRRNCILADEMGLGKTVQSIAFLQKVFDTGIEGPFLIVAPLSTICSWQREFACWTKMNAVVYHGGQLSREMIKTYEFLCRDENLDEIPGKYKANVVITTYEMIVLESSHLKDIEWKCSIIDEAHRLKNQSCKLAELLRSMNLEFKVLLTGTPLQNNIEELFALLNFLQPEKFNSTDALSAEFGDMKDNAQVEKLQEVLKPIMLRRLKEDVEKSIAPKEETVIEVELTAIQKKYYRAIMERNIEFLSKGAVSGNVPNLMNTMMELRKCCNHPFLIKGAEDKILAEQCGESSVQLMVQSSGKLVLMDKLLPKLKLGGHKVLIFSQMVRCLDILEDYLVQSSYSYERIDGGIRGSDRQAAIDRFNNPDYDRFIFLLCTRAGGLGINLTSADTVVIFDSDWNPQNDLQAQARCHRIGQKKTVKIYRLITRNSYEREMFDKANLKLGLDRAVLQSISRRQDDIGHSIQPALSKQEVENLLKLGAYGALMDEDDDSKRFCEEDIDQILLQRTQTITIAPGQKGSTFSKASFVSGEEGSEISLNDPDFWEKWAKKADISLSHLENNKLIIQEPRRRKQTKRFGGMTGDVEILAEIGSESDSDNDERTRSRTKKHRPKMKNLSKRDYFRIENSLLAFGWGRWNRMLSGCGFSTHITLKELETSCRAVLLHCLRYYNGDSKVKDSVWNLITPLDAGMTASSLEVVRKCPSIDSDGKFLCDNSAQDWIKEVDVNSILRDESFKKHLQQRSNKILLRIQMLGYIKSEILGAQREDIDETCIKSVHMNLLKISASNTLQGWDAECDRNLVLGIYKHGYGRYNSIRADPQLCFRRKYGMPKEMTVAEDTDEVLEDDKEDPEYKPAKVFIGEYSEFENSPGSTTPGTAPPSPLSSADCAKGYKSDSEEKPASKNSESKNGTEEKECLQESGTELNCDTKEKLAWPTSSELNVRVRKIVACCQKQQKQMRSRLMNINQANQKYKPQESLRERMQWTKREESDFYRTISTFGVEFSEKGLLWTRFRQLAKLDKKSDKSLDMYFVAFKAMCEEVCGHRINTSKDNSIVTVSKVSEDRASRTLYRIELLNRIRLDVLMHRELNVRIEKCERSRDLPLWWKPGQHDKELLLGMDKHGLTRTEVHILNDPMFSFSKSILEYEQILRKIKPTDPMHRVMEESRNTEEEHRNSYKEFDPEIYDMGLNSDSLFLNKIACAQKWPKDKILIQRAEHICYCVIKAEWPLLREQDNSGFLKARPTALSSDLTSPFESITTSACTLYSAEEAKRFDSSVLNKASSEAVSLFAAQSVSQNASETESRAFSQDPKQEIAAKDDESCGETSTAIPSNALLHLCLSNGKLDESSQSFFSSSSERKPSNLITGEKSELSSLFQKKSTKKHPKKKKFRKTGFISPAVLPPDSRIPVCNPSEKKKFEGADAPLNKDLADWLKQNPGFIVDYKSLRQQICCDTKDAKENYSLQQSPADQKISNPVTDPSQAAESGCSLKGKERNLDKASILKESSVQEGFSEQELLRLMKEYELKSFNQFLNNPSLAFLNSLYGTSPDMAALISGSAIHNLSSSMVDQLKEGSNQQCQSGNLVRCADESSHHTSDMPVFGLDNIPIMDNIAALAALTSSYPQPDMKNNNMLQHFKELLAQPLTPFASLPVGMNPLMHGVYGSPELPAVPDFFGLAQGMSFLESEFAKLNENDILNALQNLSAEQISLMMKPSFGTSTSDFQIPGALHQPLALIGKASPGSWAGNFNDSLRAMYQQLYDCSMEKNTSKKKGRNGPITDRSTSPSQSPSDLRRKRTTPKAKEKS